MQIVHLFYTWNSLKRIAQLINIKTARCLLHQHADAIRKSNPCSVENNNAENVGADWVKVPQPAVTEINQKGS